MTNLEHIQLMHNTNRKEFISFLCDACNDCENCVASNLCWKGHTGFEEYNLDNMQLDIDVLSRQLCDLRPCTNCPTKSRCKGNSNGFKDWLLDKKGTDFEKIDEEENISFTAEYILKDIGMSIWNFL